MSVKEYVNDILCVPVTRVGNMYIVEAIEIVLDTKNHKFYGHLSEIIKMTPQYLEKAMRDAKNIALSNMNEEKKLEIFGKEDVTTTEYVIKATEYYRRMYENKNER